MFHGEKGTTWEGGFRIPMMVRWPGVIKPGTVYNDIISLIDWFPTLCAAAGDARHQGEDEDGLRRPAARPSRSISTATTSCPTSRARRSRARATRIYYFDQGGNLNAIRWNDWKVSFASSEGNIATGTREVTAWALITNLRMDPYERGMKEGGEAMKFFAQQMWLLVPIQGKIKEFFADFDQFPYQTGSSLNAGGISYGLLRAAGCDEAAQGPGRPDAAVTRNAARSMHAGTIGIASDGMIESER